MKAGGMGIKVQVVHLSLNSQTENFNAVIFWSLPIQVGAS